MATTASKNSFLLGAAAALVPTCIAIGYQYQKEKSRKDKTVEVNLPDWLNEMFESLQSKEYTSPEEMIALAVEISAINVEKETGGPFGCAIFERDVATGVCTLFSVGCNRVVTLGNSTCHAEMIAIQMAQKRLSTFSMKVVESPKKEYVLCTSCEPCAMCLGGIFWSGISEMLCSATKDDAEAIGFNEGPVFPESYKHLEESGVKVVKGILRDKGALVLQKYGETGKIYNASGESS